MYDSEKAHAAQVEYCKKHVAPHFAPGPYNGYRCSCCKQDIYSEKGYDVERLPRGKVRLLYSQERSGITVEQAGKELICGCPFCARSFDD